MTARILIIEDEALVAMELRFVLEDLGHEVVATVADAKTARSIAAETDIDLALVDIHLSDGPTGIDLGRELAQKMGVDPQQASAFIAKALPQVIDKLTPNGTLEPPQG